MIPLFFSVGERHILPLPLEQLTPCSVRRQVNRSVPVPTAAVVCCVDLGNEQCRSAGVDGWFADREIRRQMKLCCVKVSVRAAGWAGGFH